MKKSLFAIFIILALCVSVSLAQTKKRSGKRTKKATAGKTTTKSRSKARRNKRVAVTTASGLTYIITRRGRGARLRAGDEVIVNYTGLLTNGKMFDSSVPRGEPLSFRLGAGRVIKGWDQGLQRLRIGDHATFIIPPSLGYGERGAGDDIPPGATLIFIIEVVGVK